MRANDDAMMIIRRGGGWVVQANDDVIIFPPKAGFFLDLRKCYYKKSLEQCHKIINSGEPLFESIAFQNINIFGFLRLDILLHQEMIV